MQFICEVLIIQKVSILHNIISTHSILTFSVDQIKEAISSLYASQDESIRNAAQDYLIQWKNDPSAFEFSLELLRDPTINPQITFIAAVVIEHFFFVNKQVITIDMMNESAEVIFDIIIANQENSNHPSISKLLLLISEIILLNFDFFPMISVLPPNLYLRVFSYLFEIANDEALYLSKNNASSRFILSNWGVLSLAQKNLTEQIPTVSQILLESDVDCHWYELYYQLFRFYDDFPAYYPLLEKLQQSTIQMTCPNQILKLFSLIFETDMSSSEISDLQFFKTLIELFITTIDKIISNQIEDISIKDDNIYDFVINGWDSIFNITNFFEVFGYFDDLYTIIQHFFTSLPLLVRESTSFTDLLKNFTEFLVLQASNEQSDDRINEYVVALLDFLTQLFNSDNRYFKDDPLKDCFKTLQRGLEDIVCEYISQKVQSNSVTESLFFLLSSTEKKFFDQFVDLFSNALVEIKKSTESDQISPITSLFFIRKVGVYCQSDEILMQLLEIAFNLFQFEPEEATLTIMEFQRANKSHLLVSVIPQMMELINYALNIKIEYSCGLVITLYNISSLLATENEENYNVLFQFITAFIEQYTNQIISLFTSNNPDMINHLLEYLNFIQNLLPNSPSVVPEAFKSFLFTFFSSSFLPILLINNEDVQKDFAAIFTLFIESEFIDTVENGFIVAKWLNEIIPVAPVYSHFRLLKFLIKKFPIESFPFDNILKMTIELNSEEVEKNGNEHFLIRYFIIPLFRYRNDLFWSTFQPEFLASLLRIDFDIKAVNNSLKLFVNIFQNQSEQLNQEFAVFALNTLFQSMIILYFKFQIDQSLKIIHLIISNEILPRDAVIQILLSYFDPNIDGMSELIGILSSEEDFENVDLNHESEIIGRIIQLISERGSIGYS